MALFPWSDQDVLLSNHIKTGHIRYASISIGTLSEF